jgi:uncharacterized protein
MPPNDTVPASFELMVLTRGGTPADLNHGQEMTYRIPTNNSVFDRAGLLAEVRSQFRIDFHGLHGAAHWARVRYHGLLIGSLRKADLLVIELFAVLHDSLRRDEDIDVGHGARAAHYIRTLNGRYFDLSGGQLGALCEAVADHSRGNLHDDPTIQTCWDADRLDLGRVGIRPHPKYLSVHAHPFLDKAYWMSLGRRAIHRHDI